MRRGGRVENRTRDLAMASGENLQASIGRGLNEIEESIYVHVIGQLEAFRVWLRCANQWFDVISIY